MGWTKQIYGGLIGLPEKIKSEISIDQFTAKNLKDLIEKKSTVVIDNTVKKRFLVALKEDVEISDLKGDDYEILEIPL